MKLNFPRLAELGLLSATLLALGLARPAPVAADQPIKEFLVSEDITVEGVCAFPVFMHFPANKEYEKIYFTHLTQLP